MKVDIGGIETEVFTTEEVVAREAAVRTTVEGEYQPKLTAAETERARLSGLVDARSREIIGMDTKFQKLTKDQQEKLTDTEARLYKNQELIVERDAAIAETSKRAHDSAVDAAIRAKVGTDAKLFEKMKEMYPLIQLEDLTPEQITTRVNAVFGAIGSTAPDLLASAGFGGGGFEPPARSASKDSFADSDRGKGVAKSLGLAVSEADIKKELGIA